MEYAFDQLPAAYDAETGRNSLDLDGRPEDTRVVVAMSGGVDSSVVAALLKRQGYDVVGITLQLYDHGEAVRRGRTCCAGQDIHDARRVAETLGIPHYVLDYESRFRAEVMEEFADSYLAGETPIPCVRCNQTVKFRDLLEMAKGLDAAALATGHYIASGEDADRPGHRTLLRARDSRRDQSYFLFATTQEQIDFLRFPLGHLDKAQTRALAREFGIAVAEKPDSQDICFVPDGRYADVIERLRPNAAQPGDIVHLDGRVLGRHEGIINYTIGQRRGLGVATGEPLYVVRMDADACTVVVGPKEALIARMIRLRDVNWLGEVSFETACEESMTVCVKVRSTAEPTRALLAIAGGAPAVVLSGCETGVAPGQACVFYGGEGQGAQFLGGGWIAAVENDVDAPRRIALYDADTYIGAKSVSM